mmetsp:Transcript_7091/g.22371  ORF Transcript_7091/g.22371 Transcript_7091/m.22371 type:complete len:275 (+) Transcript_7091:120-944(+)
MGVCADDRLCAHVRRKVLLLCLHAVVHELCGALPQVELWLLGRRLDQCHFRGERRADGRAADRRQVLQGARAVRSVPRDHAPARADDRRAFAAAAPRLAACRGRHRDPVAFRLGPRICRALLSSGRHLCARVRRQAQQHLCHKPARRGRLHVLVRMEPVRRRAEPRGKLARSCAHARRLWCSLALHDAARNVPAAAARQARLTTAGASTVLARIAIMYGARTRPMYWAGVKVERDRCQRRDSAARSVARKHVAQRSTTLGAVRCRNMALGNAPV